MHRRSQPITFPLRGDVWNSSQATPTHSDYQNPSFHCGAFPWLLTGAVAAKRNASAAQFVIGRVQLGAVLVEGARRLVARVPTLISGCGLVVLINPQALPQRSLVAIGRMVKLAGGA